MAKVYQTQDHLNVFHGVKTGVTVASLSREQKNPSTGGGGAGGTESLKLLFPGGSPEVCILECLARERKIWMGNTDKWMLPQKHVAPHSCGGDGHEKGGRNF